MFCVSFFILDRLRITGNRIILRWITQRTGFNSFANSSTDWMIIFTTPLTIFYIPGFILD